MNPAYPSLLLLACASPLLAAPQATAAASNVSIAHKVYTLENGLKLILHEDRSDPVVAVYVAYHVGSAREETGRSGFAHLFEHMLFQGSQHVGDDQHFKLVQEAGGNLNGNTTEDRTVYFEVLPANQLELALWLEADRMGFLLPSMTQEKLDNQRDVVKNERRQNYDNRPYGRVGETIGAALYPASHPYNWPTIGSMQDLSNATLEDVRAFFRRWYGPNNAVVAVGGDFDPQQALAWATKYFGPIPRGPRVESMREMPVKLAQTKRLVLEDKVTLPQLVLTWPSVARYTESDPALNLLAMILSQSKSSVLDRALMIDQQLARSVSARQDGSELAGSFSITINAAPGTSLDTLEEHTFALLGKLAAEGVPPEALQRVKNRHEADFVRRYETVSGRTNALATYATLAGDPDYGARELEKTLACTVEAVQSALTRWIVGQPCVILSTVPQGKVELAASGRSPQQAREESGLDRAQKPAALAQPVARVPAVWHEEFHAAGGRLRVVGTPASDVPMTTLALSVPGGHRYESMDKLGLSSLTAALMNEGTRRLSATELVDAIDFLGANLSVSADDDEITLSLTALDKHLPEALDLLGQVLLEPRFAPEDFSRVKKLRLAAIDTRGESPRAVAGTVWARLVFGAQSIDGQPSLGTRASVEKLALEDVKDFHARHVLPDGARLIVVSALAPARLRELLSPICSRWKGAAAKPLAAPRATSIERADEVLRPAGRLFLVDKPGAAQSELRIGHLAVASTDPDWYPLYVLNHILGGSFTSRINLNLREQKGYTYGARSSFEGGSRPAPFTASSGVKTEVTRESVEELMKELREILDGVSDKELDFAKSSISQAAATQFESNSARRGLLDNISRYGWPDDYTARRLEQLDRLAPEDLQSLARRHIRPDQLVLLVVGDKAKVGKGLAELGQELGLGAVVELDIDGDPAVGN